MLDVDDELELIFVFSERISEKLDVRHSVTVKEVKECFNNHTNRSLEDNDEKHVTTPPTKWFIAETNSGRELKICFVLRLGKIYIKSAYDANQTSKTKYKKGLRDIGILI